MFIAELFTMAKTWKQSKYPWTDEHTHTYTHTHTHTHTHKYYSAIKNNEIIPFTAMWMNPEIIILSKVSQKDKYHMISYI